MYGLIDLSDMLRKNEPLADCETSPFLENRGIKFNIPLDARCPSYSDSSTSAVNNIVHMWEMDFWQEYLDRMAENKYNVLSLWNLSPFPAMVRIPEFPKAYIDDVKKTARAFDAGLNGWGNFDEDHAKNLITVKKMTIDEKISFWQQVMQYAKDRCIKIYIFCWNVFVYGTEGSGYGIEADQNNPITRRYYYHAVQAMMDTYPLLAGIGISTGEHMNHNGRNLDKPEEFTLTDVGFVRETYGNAIDDYLAEHPDREFTFIHRMLMARYDKIRDAYRDFKGSFEISFKYSQAHMYSSVKPMFIGDFLEEKEPDVKVWLTVRNDDSYMFRWGSPDYAREYVKNMPVSCVTGYYMGADGYTWGRDYMTRGDQTHPLFIDKMWYMFKIWGQLSYNPELSNDYFKREIMYRMDLDACAAEKIYAAWSEASNILCDVTCTHFRDWDFQWYPEGCCHDRVDLGEGRKKICFDNINDFIDCEAITFGEHASVKEYAESLVKGTELTKISPKAQTASMLAHAEKAAVLLSELEGTEGNDEYQKTLYDVQAMILQGQYYSRKIDAACALAVYRLNGDKSCQQEAAALLQEAVPYWKEYSRMAHEANIPHVLNRYRGKVDLRDFDEYAELDVLLALED